MNRELAQSPRATALARSLEGRSLRVSAGEIFSLRATVAGGRLMLIAEETHVDAPGIAAHGGARDAASDAHAQAGARPGATASSGRADAHIEGSPFALLALFNGGTANPAGASSVHIRGDADVANRFRDLFKLLKPDIEGQAARLIGELPARGLARFSAAALGWARDALDTGRRNVAEYLVEESRDLINRTELDEFLRGVDQARETADRIEARLALLERGMAH